MIETIMIFGIGFLAAALLALLVLPALSRRAERLARRRVEARLPTSLSQIAAERDQLRADLAVEARKVEIRAEAVAAQRAAVMHELGHRDVQIATLHSELEVRTRTLTALEAEHAALIVTHTETSATLDKTSQDLSRRIEDLGAIERELAALRGEHRAVSEVAEERRLSIAGLETTAEGLRIRIGDLERDLAATLADLAADRTALAEQQTQVSVLQHKLAALQHEKDERDRLIETLRTESAALAERAAAAAQEQGDISARLAQALARQEALEAERSATTKALQEAGGELAATLDSVRADKAAAEGALATSRAERKALARDLDTLRRQHEVALATLRAENRTLRGELERLSARTSGGAEETGDATLLSERRNLRLAVNRPTGEPAGTGDVSDGAGPALPATDEAARAHIKPTASAKG